MKTSIFSREKKNADFSNVPHPPASSKLTAPSCGTGQMGRPWILAMEISAGPRKYPMKISHHPILGVEIYNILCENWRNLPRLGESLRSLDWQSQALGLCRFLTSSFISKLRNHLG
jgi:hypothetical protein